MRALIPVCLLLLAGCSSAATRALEKTPDFKAGYSDGCASASLQGANPRETNFQRDDAAFQNNAAYHRGWGEGFGACRAMTAPQTPNNGSFGAPRLP